MFLDWLQKTEKGNIIVMKVKVKVTWVYIAPSRETKALRH